MICPVCHSKEFLAVASSAVEHPYTLSRDTDSLLAHARVTVEMIFTCKTCDQQLTGVQTATLACLLEDTVIPYPLRMYEYVRKSYGDGWNIRSTGMRLNSEERDNISMAKGWDDAQAHSAARGGKAPPVGWGHAKSKEYLKTETACHHLNMISLSELST